MGHTTAFMELAAITNNFILTVVDMKNKDINCFYIILYTKAEGVIL